MHNKALRTMPLAAVQERARHGDFNAKAELYRRSNAQLDAVPAENDRSARASNGAGTSNDAVASEAQALLRRASGNREEAGTHRMVICTHEPRRRAVAWDDQAHQAHRGQVQGILTNQKN